MRIPRIPAIDNKNPFVLIDAGAAGGVQKKWLALEPHLRVIGFEPDVRSFAELDNSDPRVIYINAGLGRKKETRTLYLTRNPTASSTFPPNKEFFQRFPMAERVDVEHEVEIPIESMDEALRTKFGTAASVDFVKLDVHGIELDIIQGAREAISGAILGFEIEVCMQPLFTGGATFCDIHTALTEDAYELFDLRPSYWKRNLANKISQIKGQIAYCDALYFRSPEGVRDLVGAMPDCNAARAKVLHAISAFLVFGYGDCATSLASYCGHLFTSSERSQITACVGPTTAERLHALLFRRGKFHRVARRIADLTDFRARNWASSGRYLGNCD
jgi:FkbM family methyltransferase